MPRFLTNLAHSEEKSDEECSHEKRLPLELVDVGKDALEDGHDLVAARYAVAQKVFDLE